MYAAGGKVVFSAFTDLFSEAAGAVDGALFLCFYMNKDTKTVQKHYEKVREQP